MSLPLPAPAWAALALQQGERPGWSIDTLIQGAIVFVFFILPVLKSIFEVRKRKAGERGGRPTPARGRRGEAEQTGRDMWRELLGGGEPRTPSQPVPPPPRPAPAARTRPDRPARPKAALAPQQAEALRERMQRTEREATGRAAAEARVRESPLRAAEQPLGSLVPGVAPTGVGRLEPTVEALSAQDPATLDDEILARWGASAAPAPQGAADAATLLGSRVDWRRAVLLSELLSSPLALREASAAWPGPPASLFR